jgi:hypothetical protein
LSIWLLQAVVLVVVRMVAVVALGDIELRLLLP